MDKKIQDINVVCVNCRKAQKIRIQFNGQMAKKKCPCCFVAALRLDITERGKHKRCF